MKCDLCGGNHTTLECWKRNNPVPEAARPDGAEFASSAWVGGTTPRTEYEASVKRYYDTGTVEAHEAMLAAFARMEAASRAEMPPSGGDQAQNPAQPRS